MTDDSGNVISLDQYTGGQPGAPDSAAGSGEPALPLLTLAELREQAQTTNWLVKGAIPADSLGMLYGGSGTFKSFIALDLALHVAHGLPWLGRRTKQGNVLIIAAEGGSGLWKRIAAWHRRRGIAWKNAPVFVVPVSVDLGNEASRVTAAAARIGVHPALAIVDTLSQTFVGEENSAGEVAKYLREVGLHLRMVWEAAVLVIHHSGHNATERPRGSSALRGNVDFMYSVYRDEKEMLATLENVKQKDGEQIAPQNFALHLHHLKNDADGDPISSLVAEHVSANEAMGLMQHEAERGRGGRTQLLLELAFNGAEEKKVRQAFMEAVDGDPESKRKAYFRARKWAIDNQVFELAEGFILRREPP